MKKLFLIILMYMPQLAFCTEEADYGEPLEARTHHSYSFAKADERKGPVTFPRNQRDNAVLNTKRYVSINRNHQVIHRHRADIEPYLRVSKRFKQEVSSRFSNNHDAEKNNQDYQALAKHGAKVLSIPPEKLADDHIPISRDAHRKKNYGFSYKVVDDLTGDDFSHSQIANSKATNGEYRVKLPDGRVQIVSYRADKNGYKADVKYTEYVDGDEDKHGIPHRGTNVRISTNRKFRPSKAKQTDYFDGIQRNPALAKLRAIIPDAIPQRYDDYDTIAVLPSPEYSDQAVTVARNLQAHNVPIKVQIYTTNARDHNIRNYIPFLTSTPPTFHSANHLQDISAQIVHNGDHGLVVPPSPTPSSFVFTDQHGQVIDNIRLVTSTPVPGRYTTTPGTLYERNFMEVGSTVATFFR